MANMLLALSILVVSAMVATGFDLTILHTNDVHARFEKFNNFGSDCGKFYIFSDKKCYGGVARRFTKIQEIRESNDNVLLLDAGDQFMGTMWFTTHQGQATSHFMNRLGYNATCLGIHEFDLSINPLAEFLDDVDFPVLSSNTDVTMETRLEKIAKSKIFLMEDETEKVGVIGYTNPNTTYLSLPGDTVTFEDVVEAVTAEVTDLQSQGVNKIIALGHSNRTIDEEVAAIDGVDIVVSGHPTRFITDGDLKDISDDLETYPLEVSQSGDDKGLLVEAYMWGKYLGHLDVTFDTDGVITQYTGTPILLDEAVDEDVEVLDEIAQWKSNVTEEMDEVIGSTNVLLSRNDSACELTECNLGNLITDAIIDFYADYKHPASQWAPGAIAIWNGGGIRTSIDKGDITYNNILATMPFGNEINLLTVTGSNIREQLENSVSQLPANHGRFLQMSGIHVIYDERMPVGKRVLSVDVRCLECDKPSYSPLDDNKDYKVFVSNYISSDRDGYTFQPSNIEPFHTLDAIPLINYVAKHSPIHTEIGNRIEFGRLPVVVAN